MGDPYVPERAARPSLERLEAATVLGSRGDTASTAVYAPYCGPDC